MPDGHISSAIISAITDDNKFSPLLWDDLRAQSDTDEPSMASIRPSTAKLIPDTKATNFPKAATPQIISRQPVIERGQDALRHWVIHSWNVNGLKNVLRQGTLRKYLSEFNPTVLGLGELKQRADKLRKLSKWLIPLLTEFGYTSHFFNTCDKKNSGYSGTAIFSKVAPISFSAGWSHCDTPDLEGRVITAVFDSTVIINTYAPSSGLLCKNDFEQK